MLLSRLPPTLLPIRLTFLIAIVVLTIGCASGSPAPTAPPVDEGPDTVVVSATEYRFVPATVTVSAATQIELRNDGRLAHTWTVIAEPIEDAVELGSATVLAEASVEVGQSAIADLSGIPPGNYQVVCDIAGHIAAGMIGELVVTGD